MKFLVKLLILVSVVGVGGAAGYQPTMKYLAERSRVTWGTAEMESGDITRYVRSTGTIQPVLSVSIGSFVSGPIVEPKT